jgi:hypothetical protein
MSAFWNDIGEMIGGALGEMAKHMADESRRHWANQPESPERIEAIRQLQELFRNSHLEIVFQNGQFYARLVQNAGGTFEEYATNGGRPPGWTPPHNQPGPPPRRPPDAQAMLKVLGYLRRDLGYMGEDKPTPEELRQRYLELARQFHPDVNGSKAAAERMTRINQAYQWLNENGW